MEIMLWHDIVSNSIPKHTYQATEPLSIHELKEEVQKIQWRVVGFSYMTRKDAQTNLN